MGELPAGRISPFTRPFTFVGIDFWLWWRPTWGVLFTCWTTRAIHIEVAHAMTPSACILTIRNFVGRRGTPNEIFSDQGTNLVGAHQELKETWAEVNKDAIIEGSGLPYTTWHFIPPSAPHFGGAWERMVQTVKRTLQFIRITDRPSDAVLQNWFIEVESIVNSRPLTDVPVDREEEAPLTPNHFLLGSSAGIKPLTLLDDTPPFVRNSWVTSQRYADAFWKKWVASYLPTLTRRSKWHQPAKPLQEGDLAVVVDASLPRGCWPVGRIVKLVPSKDGTVRRVLVKTARGKVLERPAIKVAALDIQPKQT
uniref:Putative bel-2 cq-i n=1 Tax=Anopheles triannulatus TaxID=58253 RepID=A0A2M4AV77_9DIPT